MKLSKPGKGTIVCLCLLFFALPDHAESPEAQPTDQTSDCIEEYFRQSRTIKKPMDDSIEMTKTEASGRGLQILLIRSPRTPVRIYLRRISRDRSSMQCSHEEVNPSPSESLDQRELLESLWTEIEAISVPVWPRQNGGKARFQFRSSTWLNEIHFEWFESTDVASRSKLESRLTALFESHFPDEKKSSATDQF